MRSCCQTGTNRIPNFHVALINSTAVRQSLISLSQMKMSPSQGRGRWQKLLKFLRHLQFLPLLSPPPRDGGDTDPVFTPKQPSFSGESSINVIPFSHLLLTPFLLPASQPNSAQTPTCMGVAFSSKDKSLQGTCNPTHSFFK